MKFFRKTWVKIIGIIVAIVILLVLISYFSFKPAKNTSWGITYSPTYAQYLGLDPAPTFSDVLNQLKPAHVRLVTYWETVEAKQGQFDFSQTDALLNLAAERHTDVVLIIGHKQPRWPECHHPDWYNGLSTEQKKQAVLDLVSAEVEHFKTFSTISRWQVENEALFNYGEGCPASDTKALQQEVDLVKSLDSRPIVLTDSGEKGDWVRVAKMADTFGSTMYRTVYDPRHGGYVSYHLPPMFYRLRAGMLHVLYPKTNVIGVELQAEPWFARDIHDTPIAEQLTHMNAQILEDNARYAQSVGFSENYLWGVEWWYWLKANSGDDSLIKAAQKIFNQ